LADLENCTKFVQLILSKIIKIVTISCQISRLKCTKFDFGWGSAPDPAGGAYSAPPDTLAGFKGPTSKGRGEGEKERPGWKERKGKGVRFFFSADLATLSIAAIDANVIASTASPCCFRDIGL